VCVCVGVRDCKRLYMSVCVCICVCIYVCMCVYLGCVCVCVPAPICMCVHVHVHVHVQEHTRVCFMLDHRGHCLAMHHELHHGTT